MEPISHTALVASRFMFNMCDYKLQTLFAANDDSYKQ